MAWNPDLPTDNGLLLNAPGQMRANWEALELMTDADLLIRNSKIATDAAIVDTKLATISTAGKVSGAAITALTSVPSGAGALPTANLGNAWRSGDIRYTTNTNVQSLWTDISSTYNGYYVKVSSGTPLATGGSTTHSHAAGTYAMPDHYHVVPLGVGGNWDYVLISAGYTVAASFSTQGLAGIGDDIDRMADLAIRTIDGINVSAISGTSADGTIEPPYVYLRMHKKD